MNYQAFTNDSLTMMYEAIRGALASDDALVSLGEETRFRVRETPDWRKHAADLEAEMLRRGMLFDVIDWDGGQAKLVLASSYKDTFTNVNWFTCLNEQARFYTANFLDNALCSPPFRRRTLKCVVIY
jgi:hypothetical protein